MRLQVLSVVVLASLPIAAHAQTVPTILQRTTVTTVAPGAAPDFSGASYNYANEIDFNSVSGTRITSPLTIQPFASGITFTGFGGTVVTPGSVPDGTTSVVSTAVSPGGAGQGWNFGYTAGATGFLNPTIIGSQYALQFSGGGTNVNDLTGGFYSEVAILGDWSAASSHTAATYGIGYSVLQNFLYDGTYTRFTVSTTDYEGINPSIAFALLGGTIPAVPEPATWGMMILGFGIAGTALRGSRRARLATV